MLRKVGESIDVIQDVCGVWGSGIGRWRGVPEQRELGPAWYLSRLPLSLESSTSVLSYLSRELQQHLGGIPDHI